MAEERFHLRTNYLAPETVELARQELRETPEVKEKALVELRDLLHAATDLHYRDDDEFLTIFLRACHWYPQSALEKVCKQLFLEILTYRLYIVAIWLYFETG